MKVDNDVFSEEYKLVDGTSISKPDKEVNKEVEIDIKKYPIAKPIRIIIKTKII